MIFSKSEISGVLTVDTIPVKDDRGVFSRLYCNQEMSQIIGLRKIVQINYSCTHAVGAVRGLHFQKPPYAEMKLVRCLKGKVWDVAVDLRLGSPTFLQWHAVELSRENFRMLVIPEGCAHGFQVLEQDSELLYLHTSSYNPGAESAIRYNDPKINILWPLEVTDLSKRDRAHPDIGHEFKGVKI
jgi:dTDP-4-dehydrorhamnose 3,5-epimerase